MKQTQLDKILTLLEDKAWHCTREMAELYMIDYRRRLVDLKEKGYKFENRRCTKHSHPMKEWRLISHNTPTSENLPPQPTLSPYKPLATTIAQNPTAKAFLDKWLNVPQEKQKQLF